MLVHANIEEGIYALCTDMGTGQINLTMNCSSRKADRQGMTPAGFGLMSNVLARD